MYYIACFVLCFGFVLGNFKQESFLLCNKNSPKKHFAFQDRMACQPQKLQRLKSCYADVFFDPFDLT